MKINEFVLIIEFAIENEVEAYEFYKDASEIIKDPVLKETFTDLAKEELEHKKFLKEFLSGERKEFLLDEFQDYKIADTLDKPKLSVNMKFSDAISLAIKNEQEAMMMYKVLADANLDNEVKSLFLKLMEMEQMHKAKLEEIYVNVAFGEVW